jgi:hypothetical protein
MTHMTERHTRTIRQLLESLLFCGVLLLCCTFSIARAQAQRPNGVDILGQIIGDDISVFGPSHAVAVGDSHALEFIGGDTVVVHSGKGRVDFVGGGELDVCGPAKFTVLSSGQALTVALSFGRVHLRFDAYRPIVIYAPTLIATPIPLGDRPRDATIGLTDTGAMCVLATRGAVRLQNQLSGETAIVPQPSEVFAPTSSFATLPSAAGQCRCEFDEPRAKFVPPAIVTSPPVQTGTASPARSTMPPASASQVAASQPPPPPPPPMPPIVPDNSKTQSAPSSAPSEAQSAATQQALKITLPPVGYDAKSATETPEPLSVAMLILAQQASVQPEWIFHGTVLPSGSERSPTPPPSSQNAAGESPASAPSRKGFWAKLHDLFIGSH